MLLSIYFSIFFKVSPKIPPSPNFLQPSHNLSIPLRMLKKVSFKACALNKGMPMAFERLNIAKYTNFAILDF